MHHRVVETLVATQSNGQRYLQMQHTRHYARHVFTNVGPADLYEHINVFVTPENECALARPMLKYYSRMLHISKLSSSSRAR